MNGYKNLLQDSNAGRSDTFIPGQVMTLIDLPADLNRAQNIIVTLFGLGLQRNPATAGLASAILEWGSGGSGVYSVEVDLITGITIGINCSHLRVDARNDDVVNLVLGAFASYGSPSGHPSQYPTKTFTNPIAAAANTVIAVPRFARDVIILRSQESYSATWFDRAGQAIGNETFALAEHSRKIVRPNGALTLRIVNNSPATTDVFSAIFGLGI